MKKRALLGVLPVLLLAGSLAGWTESASAQGVRTLSISVKGGHTDIDEGGSRIVVFTLDSPAPAGGINISDPGIPTGGVLPVSSTVILEGQTTLELILTADDDDAYTPGRVVTLTYPNYANLPTSGSLTITLTVNDDEAPPAPPANADGSFTVPAGWALIPSGVEPGERFRLLFKTSMSRDASSTDIADYNAFVQTAANLPRSHAAIKQYSALFKAVGCTSAVSARANTDSESTDADAKIFWLNGAKLADDYADFYDGTWDNRSDSDQRDESGAAPSGSGGLTWTGCTNAGASAQASLGDAIAYAGASHGGAFSPLLVQPFPASTSLPLYAMSPVFVAERAPGANERFDLSSLDANSPAGFVFRVCGSGGGGTGCDPAAGDGDASWVPTLDPAVRLTEGGDAVSYQYRMHWPGAVPAGGLACENGTCREVDGHVRVSLDRGAFSSVRNAYRLDRDRLNCFDSPDGVPGQDAWGTWGAYVKHQANRDKIAAGDTSGLPTNELWLHGRASGSSVGTYPSRTAGAAVVSDMWGGCPFVTNSYPNSEHDVWQTVTLGAGHDADAFSHDVTLTHKVNWGHLGRMAGVDSHKAPQVRVHIVDDDEWDQNIEVASYDGTTTGDWHLLERQGLQKALPDSMDVGVTYKFKVRLTDRDTSSSESHPYSLHPASGGVSIWVDAPYTSLADDPPYGVAWSWSPYGSLNHDDTVVVSVRKDSEGPLVIRQRAPGLRQRTDTQLPRNLGADPGNPVTALASDASFTTKGYWFEEYSTVGCVGCPEVNDDSGGGDGLTPDPNDDGDGGDGLTPGSPTDNSDGDAAVDPLVKYAALVKSFYDRISDRHQHGDSPSGGWNKRFLKAMGHPEYVDYPQDAVTVARATELYNHGGPGANTAWEGTVEALEYKTAYDAGTLTPVNPPPPDPVPVITISAGSAITEGGTATFTITASPAPATPITVNVGVTESGSFGATGAATIAVSGAAATYTVTTSDDNADEPDGSVTATVQSGTGYTVGTASTATVNVADDDDPPVVVPEITISGGSAITEGGTATFTIAASPAPASPITVNVGVTEAGSFGATGAATIAVSSAVTTYTVTTSDDGVDEPDGSVTATVQSGTGYTVGTASAATVAVADDDDPPVVVPEITISGGSGVTEGGAVTFTISASPAPASPITVNVGVSESGSFGAAGAATLAVSGAATTYTVTTSDDDTDEPDGSVTATVQTGTGYTVGTASTATVAVADDDDPPLVVDPTAEFVERVKQLQGDYSAYADWASGTWHQYMVHYSSGEVLALLNSDSPVTNSVSNRALFFRAIRAAKGARDNDAAALFGEIRDHYKIKRIG